MLFDGCSQLFSLGAAMFALMGVDPAEECGIGWHQFGDSFIANLDGSTMPIVWASE